MVTCTKFPLLYAPTYLSLNSHLKLLLTVSSPCIEVIAISRAVAKGLVNWSGFGRTKFQEIYNKVGMGTHDGHGFVWWA